MTGDVAAVICTRNGHSRGFLAEALRSILEQIVAPAEIILVDDGSTDGTADEVRHAYPGVRVLSNDGSGLAAARNTGIRAAHSKWIAFLDDDDVWLPTKLAEQLAQAAASKNPESTIWASRIAVISRSGGVPVPLRALIHLASWPACLLGSPGSPSGVLLSRELLRRIGPFKEYISTGAAYEYWIRCFTAGANMCFSKTVLVHYRRDQSQMTDPSRQLAFELTVETLLLPYLEALPVTLAARIRLARMLLVMRGLIVRCGVRSATRFWAATLMRPARTDLRVFAYFVIDSAASRAPNAVRQRLRTAALRLLIGKQ